MSDQDTHVTQAHKLPAFMEGRDARPLRILSEYMEPDARFEHLGVEDTIVFMGSARTLPKDVAEEKLAEAKASGGDVAFAERMLRMSRFYEDARELARRITEWTRTLEGAQKRFVVCTGGGPGIMEAANRGAAEAGGLNMGLGITLPFEQTGNPYITPELAFEFRYFFMRKFWFVYLAKAIIFMPGGFGSMDELFETLCLIQTGKVNKKIPLVLYGKDFWNSALNMDALIDAGTISPEDVNLFRTIDTVDEAFEFITSELLKVAIDKPARKHDEAP